MGIEKGGERWENTLLEVVFRIRDYLRESNFFSYSEISTLLFLRKCIWEKETLDSGREKIAPEAQKRVWGEEEEENFNLAGENLVSRRRRRCMQGVRISQNKFLLSLWGNKNFSTAVYSPVISSYRRAYIAAANLQTSGKASTKKYIEKVQFENISFSSFALISSGKNKKRDAEHRQKN